MPALHETREILSLCEYHGYVESMAGIEWLILLSILDVPFAK